MPVHTSYHVLQAVVLKLCGLKALRSEKRPTLDDIYQ